MSRHTSIALVGYLTLIAAYFALKFTGTLSHCEWFMVIPTLFASLAAFVHARRGGWLIPLALLASAAGDYGGAVDAFLPQVACFALAHIIYLCDFVPHCRFSRGKCIGSTLYSLPLVAYLIFVLTRTSSAIEQIAIGCYGLIILSMGLATIFQERTHKWWYVVAATIFIFSDAVIVYVRVVDSLPHAGTIIMATYYAAQGAFLALHSMRHDTQD